MRNALLLDNQSMFDLCCNKRFKPTIMKVTRNALMMTSNGGGLTITEKCKIPGYKYPVWYSKKAITNVICLKNLIKCYRVTYNNKLDTTHCSAFGLPDLLFEMHPCGLRVCYPKKMGQFRFVQTMHDNMKLFSKRQIVRANKAKDPPYRPGFKNKLMFDNVTAKPIGIPFLGIILFSSKCTKSAWELKPLN